VGFYAVYLLVLEIQHKGFDYTRPSFLLLGLAIYAEIGFLLLSFPAIL